MKRIHQHIDTRQKHLTHRSTVDKLADWEMLQNKYIPNGDGILERSEKQKNMNQQRYIVDRNRS